MSEDYYALENRRLRGQLQLAESRLRLGVAAVEALREALLQQVVQTFTLAEVSELVRRCDSIRQLLLGTVEGGA